MKRQRADGDVNESEVHYVIRSGSRRLLSSAPVAHSYGTRSKQNDVLPSTDPPEPSANRSSSTTGLVLVDLSIYVVVMWL